MIDLKKFDGHTPGPWHNDDDFSFIESDDGEILATVRTTEPVHGRDAALIAAAPDLLAEVIRLRAEVAALTADAGRYRWLRVQHWSTSPLCVVADPRGSVRLGYYCPSEELLDGAIDDLLEYGAA